MAKQLANPLGSLEMEMVYNASAEISAGESEARMRDQVPVMKALSGEDTYRVDASGGPKHTAIEFSRAHVGSGADLKGASMEKDPSVKGAKDFTADPAA